MAEVVMYYDRRYRKKDGSCAVKLRVRDKDKYLYVPTNVWVVPEHWNGRRVVNCPEARPLNVQLQSVYVHVLDAVNRLEMQGEFSLTALRVVLSGKKEEDKALFTAFFEKAISQRQGRTAEMYRNTLKKVRAFDAGVDRLHFADVDADWLRRFDRWLTSKGNSVNTRGIDMRNIRTVFNAAIDEDVTKDYPFRRYKIKRERTPMRNLTLEQLRQLRDYPLDDERAMYRDLFMLSFYLCGMNAGDMLLLPSLTDGRVMYHRKKTGRLYDLPVCGEAKAIMERYKGEGQLLCPMDNYTNYHDFLQHWNNGLRRIGDRKIVKDRVGKMRKYEYDALFPDITTYWARYTFASIAAELDIPRDTIALCLGHSWADVTAVYINYNERKKIDEAVKKVVEYVNGN